MAEREQKLKVANEALSYIQPGSVVGVGTGSTVDFFIDALAHQPDRVAGAVSSSQRSSERLKAAGIAVLTLDQVLHLPLYVDGADEIDGAFALLKGGGGALTSEKVVAQAADQFVCIAHQAKKVDCLGAFGVPIELIPMAYPLIQAVLKQRMPAAKLHLRKGFVTDHGNWVADLHGLRIEDPEAVEAQINHIPGVVSNGVFAFRRADVVILGNEDRIEIFKRGTPKSK